MLKGPGELNDIIECPYNRSHQILRQRFQVHLVRCRQSYPNADVVQCPFNATHLVNKQELDWHVTVCPERKTFEKYKMREEPTVGPSQKKDSTEQDSSTMPAEYSGSTIPSENWEDEPEVPTYNPKAYVRNAPVLRMPVGLTRSQRSAFRAAERERLLALKR